MTSETKKPLGELIEAFFGKGAESLQESEAPITVQIICATLDILETKCEAAVAASHSHAERIEAIQAFCRGSLPLMQLLVDRELQILHFQTHVTEQER